MQLNIAEEPLVQSAQGLTFEIVSKLLHRPYV